MNGGILALQSDCRTTPVGLFHFAHSYAASAIRLNSIEIDATHPDAPIRFLFSHSIELYFKAFLLQNGMTIEKLRGRKLGHSLTALLSASMENGLEVSATQQDQIKVADDAIRDRYIETGVRQIMLADALSEICRMLNGQVGEKIYSANGFARNPPTL